MKKKISIPIKHSFKEYVSLSINDTFLELESIKKQILRIIDDKDLSDVMFHIGYHRSYEDSVNLVLEIQANRPMTAKEIELDNALKVKQEHREKLEYERLKKKFENK